MYRQGLIKLVQGVRINCFACAKAEEEDSVLKIKSHSFCSLDWKKSQLRLVLMDTHLIKPARVMDADNPIHPWDTSLYSILYTLNLIS